MRAQLRVLVKRILRKYGYPPDKQEKATQMVLEQAEQLGFEFASAGPIAAPFRVITGDAARPYENCIPLYSLQAAAGAFSQAQSQRHPPGLRPKGAYHLGADSSLRRW